jgi:hypothetical protein
VVGSIVHPIKDWWLKRRVRGGVRDGTARVAVIAKLGEPDRINTCPEGEVWDYHLGRADGYSLDYSTLIRDDAVVASWWRYERITAGACNG